MKLAAGLRRNSRWPKKKMLNEKKNSSHESRSLRISYQDFHVSLYREVLDLLQVVRFFFVSTELLRGTLGFAVLRYWSIFHAVFR